MFLKKFLSFNRNSNYKKQVNLYNKAVELFKKGDFANALDIFLKLYEYDFEKREVLIGMCLSYKGLNKYEESLDCINNALKLNSSFHELNIEGEILVHLGRYEEALKVLDKAISTKNKEVNLAKLTKVKVLGELGMADEAINLLNSIDFNDDEQSDANLWNIKGNNYFYLNQYEKSLECYFKALGLGYDEYGTYFNIGNAYAQLNKYEDSLIYYDKALKLNVNEDDLFYNRSLTLYHLERYDEAIISIDNALALNHDISYLNNKAGFLFKSGNFKDSLNIYKNLLKESSDDIRLLTNVSMVLCELESYDESLQYSKRALSIDSKNEDALFYKFKALKGLKQYEAALECIDELINLDSSDEDYLNEKRDLVNRIRD